MEYIKMLRDKTKNMPIITTGAAGAILIDRKILLVLHKQKNLWQIPGGLQEFGETLENTIEREIKEELSIELKVDKFLALLSDFKWGWSFENGFKIHPVTAFYIMKGNVSINNIKIQESEILKYDLFNLDNIPDNTFECCKEKVRILVEYIENLKNK